MILVFGRMAAAKLSGSDGSTKVHVDADAREGVVELVVGAAVEGRLLVTM